MRNVVALLAACVSLLVSTPARATGEREWVVAAVPEYAAQRVSTDTYHGPGLHLDVGYGITDVVALQVTGRWAFLPSLGPGGPGHLQLGGLGTGARFTFDMFQAIPFVSLAVGAAVVYESGGTPTSRWNAELLVGVGADWLVRRDFSVGFEVRYALLVPEAKRFPFAFTVGLRLAWRREQVAAAYTTVHRAGCVRANSSTPARP